MPTTVIKIDVCVQGTDVQFNIYSGIFHYIILMVKKETWKRKLYVLVIVYLKTEHIKLGIAYFDPN